MKIKKYGINRVINSINIIEVTPVIIKNKRWACIAFEEKGVDMGNFMHLAFILYPRKPYRKCSNIIKNLTRVFSGEKAIPVRIHSECILGDSINSQMCDCGKQLKKSLGVISNNGKGVLIYLRQEGRGIGLRAKLSCLSLQEGYLRGKKRIARISPDEANQALGFKIDHRTYHVAVQLLKIIGATDIALISGNPYKKADLEENGINIRKVINLPIQRANLTRRAVRELKEKASRNYFYPKIKPYPRASQQKN